MSEVYVASHRIDEGNACPDFGNKTRFAEVQPAITCRVFWLHPGCFMLAGVVAAVGKEGAHEDVLYAPALLGTALTCSPHQISSSILDAFNVRMIVMNRPASDVFA